MAFLTPEQIDEINQWLIHKLNVQTVILFGSAARGMYREDSDIDLAVLTNESTSSYELFMIAQQLADRLKREVDLIDFRQASTVLQAQIVGDGIILLDREPLVRKTAFMQALKDYARLNEERSQILRQWGVEEVRDIDSGHHH